MRDSRPASLIYGTQPKSCKIRIVGAIISTKLRDKIRNRPRQNFEKIQDGPRPKITMSFIKRTESSFGYSSGVAPVDSAELLRGQFSFSRPEIHSFVKAGFFE